jgi:dipeptidyl aminopeptidase/acylaminoacyl peptidase
LFVEIPVATPEGAYNGPLSHDWLSQAATIGDGQLEGGLSLSSDNKTIAFLKSSFAAAPEVYAGPVDKPIQITHYNDSLKPAWGKSESVTWTSPVQPSPTVPASSDLKDFNVQGWLLYPANYDPAKKYPLIVYVHGGPSSAELPHWPYVGYGPVPFAALGYFVLMPNPRGSYGQGEAFTQANRKDFGYGDLRDILAGVDTVTKSHNIDPERVGLTGWSYGGFMTMFAVTQTNRFRAAVAGAGIANWQSYYAENSIDQWMIPFMGASVYDDPGVYAKMSAVNYIHQVKTPTLAVVGDRDGECPAPQSFEFWHALKAQHVPTQLVVYPNEGHGFVDPEHQRDVIARALGWFQKYMPAN